MAKVIELYRSEWAARDWYCPAWIESRYRRGRKGSQASGRSRRNKTKAKDTAMVPAILSGRS